jgi:polygalacturonase
MTYQTPYNVKFPTYTGATLSAKGDGATNDTAAIQAAVKACAQAGGGEVYFPKGVYRVGSNALNNLASTDIPAGAGSVAINFVGEGKWASIIQLDPTLFTGQGYIFNTPMPIRPRSDRASLTSASMVRRAARDSIIPT